MIRIYCDGGCRGNGSGVDKRNIGAIGIILEYNGATKEIKKAYNNTTNNRMEITAVLTALKSIKKDRFFKEEIEIYTDSAYVVNCFREKWYVKWKMNNWKNSGRKEVKNKELFKELVGLVEKKEGGIKFFHIKGHVDLKKETEVIRLHKNFLKNNEEVEISNEEFIELLKMNHRADELVNFAMDYKIDMEEDCVEGNTLLGGLD